MAFQVDDTVNDVNRLAAGGAVTVIQGYEALFYAFVGFVTGSSVIDNVAYVGTGNGTMQRIIGGPGAPTETWTVTLANATTFNVTGSVSGAQVSGTVGTYYTNTVNPKDATVGFLINAGGTPFVNTDAFTFDATITAVPLADRWILDQWNPGNIFSNAVGSFLWWHGPGDGTQAIYNGMYLSETPASSIFLWNAAAATGFSPTAAFSNQPGSHSQTHLRTAWWQFDIPYWFVSNSRRFILSGKVSSTFHALYGGFILPFASPEEYPYPNAIFGESDFDVAFNSTNTTFSMFKNPVDPGGYIRAVDGAWLNIKQSTGVGDASVWPGHGAGAGPSGLIDNEENFPNGDFALTPLTLNQITSTITPLIGSVLGVLQGCFHVTGFNNSSETVLNIGGTDYVVFQNIFRTVRESFWALKLE